MDQPLPLEVSMQSASWFGRSGNYLVFSKTWLWYRFLNFVLLGVVFTLVTTLVMLVENTNWRDIIIFNIHVFVCIGGYSSFGPMLAVWVNGKHLSARTELFALIAAIGVGIAATYGVDEALNRGLKWAFWGNIHHKASIAVAATAKIDDGADEDLVSDGSLAQRAPLGTPKADITDERQANAGKNNSTGPSGEALVPKRTESPAEPSFGKDASPNAYLTPGFAAFVAMVIRVFDVLIRIVLLGWVGGAFDLVKFFRQRTRLQDLARQRELARAQAARNEAELKLSVLAAQVEPHFLFNTLAGVRSAILSDPARATAMVDHLVEYLRATIPKIRQDGSTNQARLQTQLEAARAYLALMQARIPRLSFNIDADDGVADVSIPPLMLISLVENAVKHGIEPKVGPGRIEVHAERVTVEGCDTLVLSVADNGVGFGGATSGSGIGLANIRERLATLYGDRAKLSLKALPEGGVLAEIRLPVMP